MGVPLFQVKPLVKQHNVTLFSANFELYGDMSQRVVAVLREVTPLIEVYSIDESFMDLSQLHIDDYDAWAQALRQRIWDEIGLPVSVGIGPTKTLAKVASTAAKYRSGAMAITDDATREAMLRDLPIEDIWGIGGRTSPKLRDKGVTTAFQLISASDPWLHRQFNVTGMRTIEELRGYVCLRFGDKDDARKTIMRSRSFGHKVRAYHQLESAVATFAAQAAQRLRAQSSVCDRITTFVATSKHDTQQRRAAVETRLPEATADTGRLITAALQALEQLYDGEFSYQKAGVIVGGIRSNAAWQLALLEGDDARDQKAELMAAMDGINARYGKVMWHATERPVGADWQSKRQLRSPRYTSSWGELPVLRV